MQASFISVNVGGRAGIFIAPSALASVYLTMDVGSMCQKITINFCRFQIYLELDLTDENRVSTNH